MEYPFKELQPLGEATARDGYYRDWTHIDADTFHQISELVKFIREKGHGTDTREAMAQALERVYHDAAQSGNANMEVSMARKNFKDLASRLDASDDKLTSTAAQLAEEIGELGAVATFKGSDTNANILAKTGMEVGDEWYDTTNQEALRWNGTAWVAVGGTLKLGDNTVNHAKLTAKSVGDRNTEYPLVRTTTPSNLFDKTKSTDNFFVSWVTGQLIASETYNASDYMDVTPGEQVVVRYFNQTAFYDLSLNFKSGVSGEAQTNQLRILTVPAGAYKMRLSTLKTNVDNQQVNRGTVLLNYDDGIPKIEDKSIADNSLRATALKNNSITSKQTEYPLLKSVKSSNLYDKSNAVKGKYVSATSGLVFDNATYELLQNIYIEPSTQYTIAHLNQIAFKDKDGTFISGQPATPNPNGLYTFTTPLGAKFMDVSTLIVWSDKQQINKGSVLLPYENGQPKIDSNSIIGGVGSRLSGLKWNALGDSFTQEVPGGSPKYHYHIANYTGVTVNDYGISGSTVSTVGGGGFEPMVNRYQDMDDDADIITVLGGINDGARESFVLGDMNSTDISTFYGAYKSLIEGLIAKYPLKTILTITPTRQNDMDRHAEDIVKAIKEISDFHSIPCLDLYSEGGFNEINMVDITKDGLHPTDFGHKWLAGKILSFIESHIPLF